MPQLPRPSSPTPRCIAIQTRFILENKQTKKRHAYLHDDLKFVPDLLVGGLKAAAVAGVMARIVMRDHAQRVFETRLTWPEIAVLLG